MEPNHWNFGRAGGGQKNIQNFFLPLLSQDWLKKCAILCLISIESKQAVTILVFIIPMSATIRIYQLKGFLCSAFLVMDKEECGSIIVKNITIVYISDLCQNKGHLIPTLINVILC